MQKKLKSNSFAGNLFKASTMHERIKSNNLQTELNYFRTKRSGSFHKKQLTKELSFYVSRAFNHGTETHTHNLQPGRKLQTAKVNAKRAFRMIDVLKLSTTVLFRHCKSSIALEIVDEKEIIK